MKKLITTGTFFLLLLTLLTTFQTKAQSLSSEDIKNQMIKEWERARLFTIDYLNAMPTDKYSFIAADSVKSFAQQMLHLAAGNVFLMFNATDQKTPATFDGDRFIELSPGAQKKDSVVYFVNASYDYCINAVKNTDITKWGEIKELFGYKETRFALMMKTFEHQTHHRGQTTIYIRELKLRPPGERLF